MFIFLGMSTINAASADNTTDMTLNTNSAIEHTDSTHNMEDMQKHYSLKNKQSKDTNKTIQTATTTNKKTPKKDNTTNTTTTTKDDTTTTDNTNTTVKQIPDIRISDNPITPGENTTFIVIMDSDATGYGVFKINGKTVSEKINVAENKGFIRYQYEVPTSYQNPTYELSFIYSGDSKYESQSAKSTLKLNPKEKDLDPKLALKNPNIKYLSCGDIVLKLDKDATGTVVFKLNKSTISPKIQVVNGEARYNFNASYTPGKYRLDAVYSGNYKFKNETIRGNLYIQKLNSTITIPDRTTKAGSTITLNAKIIDELNRPVVQSLVVFKVNGVTIGNATTNGRGVAEYRYTIPSVFDYTNYTVNVISNGTSKVNIATENATLTLKQLKTTLSLSKITSKINETVTITATPIDENKNNAHKGKVLFKINGVSQKLVNITNGYALFRYTPETNIAKNYTIEAIYQGNWKYANSQTNSTMEITKIGTITTTRYTDAKSGMQTTVSARVEDKNQVLVNGGIVVFTLNGTYLGNATVKDGAANYTFIMPRYPTGVYRLNATYMGSASYYSSNNLNYVNVTRLTSRLVTEPVHVTVGDKVNITVYVMDETSHYAENGEINITINGTLIGKAKVKNGSATIEYKPPYKYSGLTLRFIANLKANEYYASAYSVNNITISSLKDVYVSTNGNNDNLGDKQHPFRSLYYAMGHVATFGTIHILDGTYRENSILLNSSVKIIGNGAKTIIDGGASGKPIITITKRDSFLTVKSITFRNGRSDIEKSGGVLHNYGKVNVTDCKFISNKARGNSSAGAIYSTGEVNITNCEFINNTLTHTNAEGGALRLINNTTNIINSNFTENRAVATNSSGGGAIYMQDGSLTIKASTFKSNKATGKTALGGAIKGIYGNLVVTSTNFKDNVVNGTDYGIGGAINSLATGVYLNLSTIESNKAYGGVTSAAGALYTQYAAVMAYSSVFKDNLAQSKTVMGGTIQGYYAFSNYVNCTFTKNMAKATATNSFGGVIYYELGNLTVSSCRFNMNEANSANVSIGAGIYAHANTTIYHCDFMKNKVSGKNIGGGAIANLANMTVTKTNFIDNNATNAGNAITAVSGSSTTIEDNYWNSNNPQWKKLLIGVNAPKNYSKTKITH